MKCTMCQGKRVVVRMEPETWGSSRNWCYTNREVERRYMCERCNGTGIDPEPEGMVIQVLEIDGHAVDAPGFTAEQFAAAVERAKREQLRTTPGKGCVMVQSGSDDARYTVTRDHCDCKAGHTHGHCKHRALVIYLADVEGVDVLHTPTIGFSKSGVSLTIGRKPAAKTSWLDRPVISRFRAEVA